MSKEIQQGMTMIAFVSLLVIAITAFIAWRPSEYFANDLETGQITTGTGDDFGTTITLSDPGTSCSFCNEDATAANAIDVRLNAIAQSIRIYGGSCYNTEGDIPFFVSSFTYDAVAGTPILNYVCLERE